MKLLLQKKREKLKIQSLMTKSIIIKSHYILPPSVKMTLLITTIVVILTNFQIEDLMKLIIHLLIIAFFVIMVLLSRVDILFNINGVYKISNFVFFRLKKPYDLSNYDSHSLIKKKKTYSSSGSFRPTAKEFYSRESVDIILLNSTKRIRKKFLSIENQDDALTISKLLSSEMKLEKVDYKLIYRYKRK